MDLRGKSVLITGIAGFVGANLARGLLARGARVHGVVRSSTDLWRLQDCVHELRLHAADLTAAPAVEKLMSECRPSLIFHMATGRRAKTPQDRAITVADNVLGTLNLLEAARASGCERFVYAGSSLEYGPKDQPSRETDRLAPSSFFGASKAATTLLCQQFAREHQLPLVILRIYSVYGPWEGPERLIPTAMLAALGDGAITLTAEPFRRDFIFVDDVVQACLRATEVTTNPGEIVNIGSGQQWSNQQAVALIESIVGRTLRRNPEPYPGHHTDTTFWVADNSKARSILGWQPQHTLPEGLAKTWDWLLNHREHMQAAARHRTRSA